MRGILPLILITLVALPTLAPHHGVVGGALAPGADCMHATGPFLQAEGTDLWSAQGRVTLYGATMYPLMREAGRTFRGSAWAWPSFPTYIRSILDLAGQAHLNTIRVTDYLAGATRWDDPVVWSNIDDLMCQAQQRHMFVIISLSAYRNWLEKRHQFGYNPDDWTAFLRFVGQRYQWAPALAYYALAGEPVPPHSQRPLRPTARQLVDFYRATAAELYSADGAHHLISTGGLSYLNWDSGIPWQTLFALPHIAMATIHVYSRGDRDKTLPMVGSWAVAHGKPLVVEEFGFRQDMGDGLRAAAFADLYARAARAHAGGVVFWNLGEQLDPQSFDVSPHTPLVWHTVQQFAPASMAVGPATPTVTAGPFVAATPSPSPVAASYRPSAHPPPLVG